jgi:hypothetical protein
MFFLLRALAKLRVMAALSALPALAMAALSISFYSFAILANDRTLCWISCQIANNPQLSIKG